MYTLTSETAAGVTPGMRVYTTGVKLVCEGSPALLGLRLLQGMGVAPGCVLDYLEHFQGVDKVAVGEVGGINHIVALLAGADSMVTV